MRYKFLIYISYSYSVPIGNPIEKELQKRNHDVSWFADEEEGYEAIKMKPYAIKDFKEIINYNPDVVLVSTNNVPHFISGLKVQLFHGIFSQKRPDSDGNFAFYRIRGFFDLYCTHGPATTSKFKELANKHGHFMVRETGFSKMDPLFPIKSKSVEQKPVVLISSTFTPRLSLAHDNDVFNQIKLLRSKSKYQFIMVLHPKIDPSIKQKWKTLEDQNFRFLDTTHLIPLFEDSDIMLSDVSSVIPEYLLQKKPVVSYNHNFDHDYLLHLNRASELEKSLDLALTYPKEILVNIEKYINAIHPYTDGNSSARVIDACVAMLEDKDLNLKKKPLNLIRKLKIRKKLGYWKI